MRVFRALPFMIVAAALSVGPSATMAEDRDEADEHETPVTIDKVPAAAKATIDKERQGNSIKSLVQGTQKDKTYYEAKVEINKKLTEIKVDPDGKLLHKGAADSDD